MGRACWERREAKAGRGEGFWGEIPVQPWRGAVLRGLGTCPHRFSPGAEQIQEVWASCPHAHVWAHVRTRRE